jgi:endo-1,4-beta-xylanase
MSWKWISFVILCLVLLFQYKNISSFIAVELALKGFKELDVSSDDVIDKSEWPGMGFSIVDMDRDNLVDDKEIRFFIREFSKEFSWINKVSDRINVPEQLIHSTFISPSMDREVGYYIYIPDSYHKDLKKKFRTVYYLHGGRPGNESRSVIITNAIHELLSNSEIDPALYVFVNGGELSHYNSKEKHSYGEDVFIKELIPHIDNTYRTIASRSGRGLEGFSQGGRGATRYMFKYPEIFSTVAAGGGSYEIEKLIQQNNGYEDDPRGEDENVYFVGEGNDAWSLAKKSTETGAAYPNLLIWSGTEDPNYPSIKIYMNYLDKLDIEYDSLIVKGVDHNPFIFYEQSGEELIRFHAKND